MHLQRGILMRMSEDSKKRKSPEHFLLSGPVEFGLHVCGYQWSRSRGWKQSDVLEVRMGAVSASGLTLGFPIMGPDCKLTFSPVVTLKRRGQSLFSGARLVSREEFPSLLQGWWSVWEPARMEVSWLSWRPHLFLHFSPHLSLTAVPPPWPLSLYG